MSVLRRGDVNLTTTGVIELNVSMNENVMYEDRGMFIINASGFAGYGLNPLS